MPKTQLKYDSDGSPVVSSVPLNAADMAEGTAYARTMQIERHEQSMQLRDRYGLNILIITAVQVAFVDIMFVANGFSDVTHLHISDDIFKTYTISVFATVIALATVVTRNLFPPSKTE